MLLNIQSGRGIFAAEAGTTYYFAASTNSVYTEFNYSITLRKTVAEDAGYSAAYPIELTSESSSIDFEDFKGSKYFAFTNSGEEAIAITLVVPEVTDSTVSTSYYSDKSFDYSSNLAYGNYVATVEPGATIYMLVEVYTSPNTFTGAIAVQFSEPEPPVEPDIPEGVDPTEVQIPSGGNAIAGVGYWQISVTAEDVYEDYFEVMLYFTGEAGTYNVTCQEGSSVVDSHGAPMTQIVSTGTAIRFYFDADKVGDYIITVTAVTEEA